MMPNHDPDILITRIIDGRDTPEDWSAFEAFAASEPGIYRELAIAKRDHRLLSLHIETQTAVAERISAPVHMLHRGADHPRALRITDEVQHAGELHLAAKRNRTEHGSVTARSRSVAMWGGWAAAAAIGLAVIGRGGGALREDNLLSPSLTNDNTPSHASVIPVGGAETLAASLPFGDAQSALDAYISQGKQDGRVLTQQPMRILAMEQLPDGAGYRLVYERPIVESAVVSRPYGLNASGFEDPLSPTRLRMEPLRITPRERSRGEIQ